MVKAFPNNKKGGTEVPPYSRFSADRDLAASPDELVGRVAAPAIIKYVERGFQCAFHHRGKLHADRAGGARIQRGPAGVGRDAVVGGRPGDAKVSQTHRGGADVLHG